jgi:hypothetical protein
MSLCNECITTECRDLYVNPCDTGIPTGILAVETDDYTVFVEFNGTVKEVELACTEGEEIILPNMLMPPYVHVMRIYNSTNELMNDTCYKLYTKLKLGVGNNITPTPPIGAKKRIVVDVDGDSFTNSFFGEHTIIEIVTSNQSYIYDTDFTQDGSTITWINGNTFYDGQVILAIA